MLGLHNLKINYAARNIKLYASNSQIYTQNIARAHAKRTRTRINYNRVTHTAAAAKCRRMICNCGVDDFTKCYDLCL